MMVSSHYRFSNLSFAAHAEDRDWSGVVSDGQIPGFLAPMLEELLKDFDLPVSNGPGNVLEEDFNRFLGYIGESKRYISICGMTRVAIGITDRLMAIPSPVQ